MNDSLIGEVTSSLAVHTNKFGRPSKLTHQVVEQARDYVEQSDNMSAASLMPTVERLAINLGVHRDTLYAWAEKNQEFSDILMQLGQIQADKLLQNGLVGRYNPVITKLMLSKHGYIEKQEVDSKVEVVQPIVGGMAKKQIESDVHTDDDN